MEKLRPSAKAIDKAIKSAEPKTWMEVLEILGQFRFRNGIAWSNVYYMGSYQGLRLHYFDSKNNRVELPSKTEVYVVKEHPELGKIHVDATGKEIKGYDKSLFKPHF
jgi:hypothetical protein